jgi:hypothetical protein
LDEDVQGFDYDCFQKAHQIYTPKIAQYRKQTIYAIQLMGCLAMPVFLFNGPTLLLQEKQYRSSMAR